MSRMLEEMRATQAQFITTKTKPVTFTVCRAKKANNATTFDKKVQFNAGNRVNAVRG